MTLFIKKLNKKSWEHVPEMKDVFIVQAQLVTQTLEEQLDCKDAGMQCWASYIKK